MSYKTILVHLHDVRRAQRLLDVAVPLARKMNAHLIGLNVMPPYVVLPGGEVGGGVTVEAHREAYGPEIAKLKESFASATSLMSGKAEWREIDANFTPGSRAVVEHGRTADLVIVSQKDPQWTLSEYLEDPAQLAMECGRPVLLVPNTGSVALPYKRATIAWNGRREAARAVFDAMPLLYGVEEVNILSVQGDHAQAGGGDVPGADLAAMLSRHGLKCVLTQTPPADSGIGTELLRQAQAFGSGLLVMGVYGHSRLREFVLGGASREVLQQMDRLVLMSH